MLTWLPTVRTFALVYRSFSHRSPSIPDGGIIPENLKAEVIFEQLLNIEENMDV
jgi:hypothetical protein